MQIQIFSFSLIIIQASSELISLLQNLKDALFLKFTLSLFKSEIVRITSSYKFKFY